MPTDDERNVDDQLDEAQAQAQNDRQRPLIENHRNNTRTAAAEENAAAGAAGTVANPETTVTDPATSAKEGP